MQIFQALRAIKDAATADDLWTQLDAFLISEGILAYSYHHMPAPGASDFCNTLTVNRPLADGYEDVFKSLSHQFDVGLRDRARTMTDITAWTASDKVNPVYFLPSDTIATSGFFLPVYGPRSRNGCYSVFLADEVTDFTAEGLNAAAWACQIAHQSFCRIRAQNTQSAPKLTCREIDTLSWMAQGKTNGEIADILGISSHTVGTYTRRIFIKTNTSDRTSASLYGISNGLLTL